jgi:DNA-binding transcriptional LysR family regulator
VLARFAQSHPNVELTLQVDRSAKLIDAVADGAIDVAIAIRRDHPLNRGTLTEIPMIWIGRDGLDLAPEDPVPLVMFDPPCSFRSAAIEASRRRAGRTGSPSRARACLACAWRRKRASG